MIVEKKCWPKFFEKVLKGEKNTDLRLNDFEIKKGDVLVLEEFDPKTKKYTGRHIDKKVSRVNKLEKVLEMYPLKELKKKGLQLIEFEK